MKEIKRLPKSVRIELELQNKARRLSNMQELQVKIYTCPDCGRRYESLNRRRCGCIQRQSVTLQGHQVL